MAKMTDEQKELWRKSESAIAVLTGWHKSMKEEKYGDMRKMLATAIKTFEQMRSEWAFAIGQPQTISKATLDEITKAAINIIHRRVNDKSL